MTVSHSETMPVVAFYGFRGGKGGISHVMLNLMNAMVDFGVEVHLLLNATDIPELARVRPEIKVFRLGTGRECRRVLQLARYLKAHRPQALLANRERANRCAILARMLSGSPVKIVIRVGMAISKALERRSWLKRLLRRRAIRFCYQRADVVIANAAGVARDIEAVTALGRERICILENPTVSAEMLRQAAEPGDHPWLEPGQPPVIIGVGRLAKQKDFPTLLKAFSTLRAERDCRLLILGEGKERTTLEKLTAELGVDRDVDLFGFVANPFRYMSRAALFVLSSAWEGSPNVLIQALALGVPSVATDCPGGAREILADGTYGSLVPVGDHRALSEAMRSALEAPLPAAVLRTGGERFRAEPCTRAYLDVMGLDR